MNNLFFHPHPHHQMPVAFDPTAISFLDDSPLRKLFDASCACDYDFTMRRILKDPIRHEAINAYILLHRADKLLREIEHEVEIKPVTGIKLCLPSPHGQISLPLQYPQLPDIIEPCVGVLSEGPIERVLVNVLWATILTYLQSYVESKSSKSQQQ